MITYNHLWFHLWFHILLAYANHAENLETRFWLMLVMLKNVKGMSCTCGKSCSHCVSPITQCMSVILKASCPCASAHSTWHVCPWHHHFHVSTTYPNIDHHWPWAHQGGSPKHNNSNQTQTSFQPHITFTSTTIGITRLCHFLYTPQLPHWGCIVPPNLSPCVPTHPHIEACTCAHE